MANGLMCQESLPVTPKLRRDSDSENTPPDFGDGQTKICDLLCTEVIDELQMQKPCFHQAQHPAIQQPQTSAAKPRVVESFNFPPVRAECDTILLRDDRVLQNLLRNEERYASFVNTT